MINKKVTFHVQTSCLYVLINYIYKNEYFNEQINLIFDDENNDELLDFKKYIFTGIFG